MSVLLGFDSWEPPTQPAIDALKLLDGFAFGCGYVGGADLYLNTPWPKEAWDLLRSNNVKPLPIWVPKQDCSEDPVEQANLAIAACLAVGLTGTVAIDSEHSMSTIMNFQSWLDRCFAEINRQGWHAVNYEGSHYDSPLAFQWLVMWGEHEEIPPPACAIQYGSYVLRTPNGTEIMTVDSDSADENFPFAEYINPANTPVTPNEPIPKEEDTLDGNVLMNDGHEQFLVNLTNRTAKGLLPGTELQALASVIPHVDQPCPIFISQLSKV